MPHAARVAQEPFSEARREFEDLSEQLLSPVADDLTHRQAADLLERPGREVLRQLLPGWLERRGVGDGGPALAGQDGVQRPPRRLHSCTLERLCGTVQVERRGSRPPGPASLHPLDAALHLPQARYSHALRKKVAGEAARSRCDEVGEAIPEPTGAPGPKRQAEERGQRAAQDFAAFDAPRRAQHQEPPAAAGAIVVRTTEGKGVPRRPEALRPQRRKAAEARTHKLQTRLSKGEKRPRNRLAPGASVDSLAP